MSVSVVVLALLCALSRGACNVTTVSGAEDPFSDDEVPLKQAERADILVRLHGTDNLANFLRNTSFSYLQMSNLH